MRGTIIFLSLSTLVSSQEQCDKDGCPPKPCLHWDPNSFNADSPSIMYGEAHGRFGNHFLGYMVFAQMRESNLFDAYIDAECKRYVEAFFTPESRTVPVLSEVYCNPEDIIKRMESFNGKFSDLVSDPSLRKGKILWFYKGSNDKLADGYRPEDHISNEQEQFQQAYMKHLNTKMEFRNNYREKVDRRLRNLAKKLLSKKPEEVTYVGVHVRRTDHLKFMRDEFKMEPLDAEYFNDAMDYFRDEYENCLFVVASDDIKWAKKKIDQSRNDVYFSDSKPSFHYVDPGKTILMDDDLSKAAYDLALLTRCNHTVISRGTYSMWVAVLTPGEYMTEYGVIVPPELQ